MRGVCSPDPPHAARQYGAGRGAIAANAGDIDSIVMVSFAEIKTQLEAIMGDNDIGDILFYFTQPEIKKLKKNP